MVSELTIARPHERTDGTGGFSNCLKIWINTTGRKWVPTKCTRVTTIRPLVNPTNHSYFSDFTQTIDHVFQLNTEALLVIAGRCAIKDSDATRDVINLSTMELC